MSTSPERVEPGWTSSDLVDRYVDVALRGTHGKARDDLELELRALIGDTVDATLDTEREGHGPEPTASEAEYSALTQLGDPTRLADRFRGRSPYLIGPALYYQWRRLLRLLLWIVVPILALLTVFGKLVDGDSIVGVLGAGVWAGATAGIFLTFWTTVVFAAIERFSPESDDSTSGDPNAGDSDWTPDDLPDLAGSATSAADTALSIAMSALVIGAMFWQRSSTVVTDNGAAVPILNPDGWSLWWPLVIAFLVVEAIVVIAAFRQRRWTAPLFWAYAVSQVGFVAAVLWLVARDEFFNPAFIALLDWGENTDPARILGACVAVGVVAVTGWDVIEKVRATWRR